MLFKIVLPLSMPILAVAFLMYSVGYWNSWFAASIYLRSESKYPLQLILLSTKISAKTMNLVGPEAVYHEENAVYAEGSCIVLATAPMHMLYPFIQKNFVKGHMIGAIKG
ncbi:MAG: carbohydrate ABC transporter permease [Acutalibacter muris]|nr:carbohydrate ABC transporter permease [Acutalibacter muris]